MDLGLKDKCALLAGSSRGLGYATAMLLAREERQAPRKVAEAIVAAQKMFNVTK